MAGRRLPLGQLHSLTLRNMSAHLILDSFCKETPISCPPWKDDFRLKSRVADIADAYVLHTANPREGLLYSDVKSI